MNKRSHIETTPAGSWLLTSAKSVRQRIVQTIDRGQLGPSREDALRAFAPRR